MSRTVSVEKSNYAFPLAGSPAAAVADSAASSILREASPSPVSALLSLADETVPFGASSIPVLTAAAMAAVVASAKMGSSRPSTPPRLSSASPSGEDLLLASSALSTMSLSSFSAATVAAAAAAASASASSSNASSSATCSPSTSLITASPLSSSPCSLSLSASGISNALASVVRAGSPGPSTTQYGLNQSYFHPMAAAHAPASANASAAFAAVVATHSNGYIPSILSSSPASADVSFASASPPSSSCFSTAPTRKSAKKVSIKRTKTQPPATSSEASSRSPTSPAFISSERNWPANADQSASSCEVLEASEASATSTTAKGNGVFKSPSDPAVTGSFAAVGQRAVRPGLSLATNLDTSTAARPLRSALRSSSFSNWCVSSTKSVGPPAVSLRSFSASLPALTPESASSSAVVKDGSGMNAISAQCADASSSSTSSLPISLSSVESQSSSAISPSPSTVASNLSIAASSTETPRRKMSLTWSPMVAVYKSFREADPAAAINVANHEARLCPANFTAVGRPWFEIAELLYPSYPVSRAYSYGSGGLSTSGNYSSLNNNNNNNYNSTSSGGNSGSLCGGVAVESLFLDYPTVHGDILVRNITFHKQVTVRITFDFWSTSRDVEAVYSGPAKLPFPLRSGCAPENEGIDRFHFTFDVSPHFRLTDCDVFSSNSVGAVLFAVRYKPAGYNEVWDNNRSSNYSFRIIRAIKENLSFPGKRTRSLSCKSSPTVAKWDAAAVVTSSLVDNSNQGRASSEGSLASFQNPAAASTSMMGAGASPNVSMPWFSLPSSSLSPSSCSPSSSSSASSSSFSSSSSSAAVAAASTFGSGASSAFRIPSASSASSLSPADTPLTTSLPSQARIDAATTPRGYEPPAFPFPYRPTNFFHAYRSSNKGYDYDDDDDEDDEEEEEEEEDDEVEDGEDVLDDDPDDVDIDEHLDNDVDALKPSKAKKHRARTAAKIASSPSSSSSSSGFRLPKSSAAATAANTSRNALTSVVPVVGSDPLSFGTSNPMAITSSSSSSSYSPSSTAASNPSGPSSPWPFPKTGAYAMDYVSPWSSATGSSCSNSSNNIGSGGGNNMNNGNGNGNNGWISNLNASSFRRHSADGFGSPDAHVYNRIDPSHRGSYLLNPRNGASTTGGFGGGQPSASGSISGLGPEGDQTPTKKEYPRLDMW